MRKFSPEAQPPSRRALVLLALLLYPTSARAESAVLMEVHSLEVSKSDLDTLSELLGRELEGTGSVLVVRPAALSRQARLTEEIQALLTEAEASFQRGRERHLELDFNQAAAAYRDAISAYGRAAAGLYQPEALAEAHLQLGVVLSQTARLPEALAQLRRVITLAPWLSLDPSLYNPTVRKLYEKERKAAERLPDVPADAPTLQTLGRLGRSKRLVRPLVTSSGERLVLHAAVIDLEAGTLIGVESTVLNRSLADAGNALGDLSRKLLPLLGAAPGTTPQASSAPTAPAAAPLWLSVEAGGFAGFGDYPRLGAQALRLRFELPATPRLHLSFGAGLRLSFASQVKLQDPPSAPVSSDLTLFEFPLQVGAQVFLLQGDPEFLFEICAVFDLLYLSGDNAKVGPEHLPILLLEGKLFGYGPGFLIAFRLGFRLGPALRLVTSAGYTLSKVFYTEDFVVPDPGGGPQPIRPRDVLQGVELSVGVAFDL